MQATLPTRQTITSDAPAGPLIVPASSPNGIRLSLIVPTLNEGQNIAAFLRAVRDQLDPVARGRYEIIVMDDDSRDRTWEIAAALASEIPALKVVRRRTEKALSAAVIRGWQAAAGEILGTINADFQHPPAVLPALLEHMEQADLAIASRFAEGGGLGDWAAHRRLNSRVAHTLGRALLPRAFRRTSDPLSGCYMVRRDAIAGIELHPLGFKTLMEILVRGRIRTIRESSYEMRARKLGRSKLRARHWFDFFFHLLRLRRAAGAGSPVQ